MKTRNVFRKTIIIVSSGMVYFILYGVLRLNSQLFVAVRERFGTNREQGSFPFILLITANNLSGPLIGFLGKKLGLRCTTVLGCIVSFVSIALCFLVEDITAFTVLWGIGFGSGFGLGTLLIPNIVHQYFTKTFNLVQGIFHASGSLGSLALPGLADYLLRTYGTSGTFLILSGLVLNSVPVAMLLKCPEKSTNIKRQEIKESGKVFITTNDVVKNVLNCVCRMNSEKMNDCEELCHCQDTTSGVVIDVSYLSKNIEPCQICTRKKNPSVNLSLELSKAHTGENQIKDFTDVHNTGDDRNEVRNDQFGSHDNVLFKDEKSQSVQYNRNAILTEHVTAKNVVFKGNCTDSMEDLDNTGVKFNKYHVTKPKQESNFMSRYLQVFLDPAYILILLSMTVMIPVTVFMTVMLDACRDKGILEDLTILMTFATADLTGRLVFGYLADLKCTSALNIFALNCGLFGLLLMVFPWLNEFYNVVVFFAVSGSLMGGIVITPPGIIIGNIEKNNFTMAFSSRYFLVGVLNLSQPVLIGYFRETLQSYDGLFYSLGSMCFFGTVTAMLVPTAARYRNKKKGTFQS